MSDKQQKCSQYLLKHNRIWNFKKVFYEEQEQGEKSRNDRAERFKGGTTMGLDSGEKELNPTEVQEIVEKRIQQC